MSSTRNEKNVSPTSPQAKLSAVASTSGKWREEEGSGTAETTAQCAPPPKTVRAVSTKQQKMKLKTQLKMLRNWHITDVEAEEGNAEETETTKKVTPEAVLDFNAADAEWNDEDPTEIAASTAPKLSKRQRKKKRQELDMGNFKAIDKPTASNVNEKGRKHKMKDPKDTQEEFQLQSKKRKTSLPDAATEPDKKKKNMRESAIPGDQGDDSDAPGEVTLQAASAEAQKAKEANKQRTRLEHERLLQDKEMANQLKSARAEAEKEKTARERSDQLLADVRAQLTVANQNNQDQQQEDLDSLRQDLASLRQENDHQALAIEDLSHFAELYYRSLGSKNIFNVKSEGVSVCAICSAYEHQRRDYVVNHIESQHPGYDAS